ncbi:MAG: LVIVD repeat-containing protein [Gemmatimonadota bacterium]
MGAKRIRTGAAVALFPAGLLAILAPPARGQEEAPRRSSNVRVLSHVPLGPALSVTDIVIEQDLSRPYAYVGRMQGSDKGFDIIDLRDPARARILYRWRIEDVDLHQGLGGMDPKYFKLGKRVYLVQSVQFAPGPDNDTGAIVFDVTGLPNVSKIREVARIHAPDTPGGFHNIFMYKHSDGRALLFTTVRGTHANVYDMEKVVKGRADEALVGRIPLPETAAGGGNTPGGYHDMYVGYHSESGQDRFYGGGTGGYFVFDVTDVDNPELLTSLTGINGVQWGHTFTPTPDGNFAVGETEYQYSPLRIYDLRPGLSGEVPTITSPVSAWTADWRNLSHNHEMRWPYVFVSGYEDGLQVFNMMDPMNPTTVGYYDTYVGPHKAGMCSDAMCNGAFGVDVRNADGLIVVSDMSTGFWAFRMDGFQGWDGRGWGMPNISSAQDWENGPMGESGD